MNFWSAALLALTLAATPAFAADPQDCGTIVVPPGVGLGPGGDITSFNPDLITSAYNGEAVNLLFTPLIWVNRFHTIDWTRSIATAITTPDQGTTYDVTMRPWTWSDGVPVTTTDVLYAYNLMVTLGTNYDGYGSGGMPMIIKSIKIIDAEHFEVVLTHQVNPDWFTLNGLAQLMPLPAHLWSHYNSDQIWQQQSNPAFFQVVDGPLIIKQLNTGIDAVFVPNPEYAKHGPPMHFSRFIMKFMDSEGQALQEMESGNLDMANLPFALFDKAQHLPGLYTVTLEPTYSWHELELNEANKTSTYFADIRVRQAIADAINQPQMIKLAMHGYGIPVYGPVPPVPDTFLSPAAKAGKYPVGYNPAKAIALLKAAGFIPGPDGIMQKNGTKIDFTVLIPAGQPLRIEMAESMQQNLRAIGIVLKIHQVEINQIFSLLVNAPQAWQAILIAEDMLSYPSGEGFFKTGGYFNNDGYSNPLMDKYIDASTNTPGLSGLFAYQDFASAQQPVIFLPVEQFSVLARKNIHGLNEFMSPTSSWSPEQLYCTKN